MLNRVISFSFALCILLSALSLDAHCLETEVSAESAILMNADTGEIVFEKNIYKQRGMASTTKIMTALLALEKASCDRVVTAEQDDVTVEGTSIGLQEGDKITIGTLVAGMLLESGNDAANVTAAAVGGTREKFIAMMNAKARELGMNNTNFVNPSGLPDEEHYSTAYDMALLGCYAILNTDFCNICALGSKRVSYGTPEYERTFTNHNKLLSSVDGVFGIKTGFTKASGRCLVSAATREGATLVCVTLKAPDDWHDHKKLYEYGFDKLKKNEIKCSEAVKIAVVGSDKKYITAKAKGNVWVYSHNSSVDTDVKVLCEPFLYAGVAADSVVGSVRITGLYGKVLGEVPLIATDSALQNFNEMEYTPSFFQRVKIFLEGLSF